LAARARVEADYQWERNLAVLDRLFAETDASLKAHDTAERTGV
jgi:hypothetical protein